MRNTWVLQGLALPHLRLIYKESGSCPLSSKFQFLSSPHPNPIHPRVTIRGTPNHILAQRLWRPRTIRGQDRGSELCICGGISTVYMEAEDPRAMTWAPGAEPWDSVSFSAKVQGHRNWNTPYYPWGQLFLFYLLLPVAVRCLEYVPGNHYCLCL